MSKLVLAAYASSTLARYKPAVVDFINYCDCLQLSPTSPESFDDVLASYIDFLYESAKSRGRASAALQGLCLFLPHLKGHLLTSQLCLRGWARLQPAKSFPPLTWPLTCLISLRLLLSRQRLMAIAVLLGFHCLLRIGEVVGLHREDVADSGDHRLGSLTTQHMFLRLRHTKTGPNQWVSVTDPHVQFLLRSTIAATQPYHRVFPFSAAALRINFKRACAQLGLSPDYVPHSLRHGGATLLSLDGVPMEDILARGRWASTKSARRYVQGGRALLLNMAIPARTASLAFTVSQHIISFFSLRSLT